MRNFHVKSILLGIGIGIVITSLISMIYASGINTNKAMSDQEIMKRARDLGMVENDSLLDTRQSDTSQNTAENSNEETTKEPETVQETTNAGTAEPPAPRIVTISVVYKDTSEKVAEKLLQSKLISDKKAFIKKITEMKRSSRIRVGTFEIEEGSSMEDIIKKISR